MLGGQTRLADTVRFERSLIGSMLNGDIRATDSELRTADFTDALCARVFGAALTLEARGKVCDLVTVTEFCPDLDASALVELAQEAAPVASLAAQHGRSIREAAQRRAVRAEALRLAQEAADPEKPVSELLDSARARLDTLAGALPSSGAVDGVDALCAFYENLNSGPVEPVTRFGFSRIDDALTIAGGKLIVIGARPSVGKSALLLHLAMNAMDAGRRVLLVSLEMSETEIIGRMVARKSGVPVGRISNRNLSDGELERVAESFALLPGDRFCVSVKTQTPRDVRREALRMRADGGLDLIVVDYLQLMTPGQKAGNRTEAVGIISRGLKLLAMEEHIPVITASQLNRASERNDAPLLSDLRESGSIEQDADAVLLLHAPDEKEQPARKLTLAKNRQGRCGGFDLLFDGSRMLFSIDGERR